MLSWVKKPIACNLNDNSNSQELKESILRENLQNNKQYFTNSNAGISIRSF